MTTASHHPQHGPSLALTALLTEHPDLPYISWSLAEDGVLRGHKAGTGMRAVADAYAAVLGGVRHQPMFSTSSTDGRLIASVGVVATWRDVTVSVWLLGDAAEYPEYATTEAVAA